MMSSLMSGCIQGLKAHLVRVEVDLQPGLPSFALVGLPDPLVKESRERVRSAFKNSNLTFPMKRITVNLAPAHLKKEGSSFELAIALSLFMADQKWNSDTYKESLFLGELSLQGKLNSVRGVLPIIIEAKNKNIQCVYVPIENVKEASVVEGVQVIGVESLKHMVDALSGTIELRPSPNIPFSNQRKRRQEGDFSEVKGQVWAKRAMEIAAAGGHNVLLMGPPGCGKSMLAKRFPTILPPLSFEESLETSQVYSISGLLTSDDAWVYERPFRHPHHTASYSAIVGGGRNTLMPGEVSLAHYGVLFLDEVTEFRRDVLQVLREPLEDGKISISRTYGKWIYPARFMLICAMNPCPCGWLASPRKECVCRQADIERYRQKLSGPLLDRIDLHVAVSAVALEEIKSGTPESSDQILNRVGQAREIQMNRFKGTKFFTNTDMSPSAMAKYCILESQAQKKLDQALNHFGFSYRTYQKILKVARTIADLDREEKISLPHIAQAIQLRFLDRERFNGGVH